MTRRPLLALVAGVLALSGCGVGMPESGPVQETETVGSSADAGAGTFNPRPPGDGDTPQDIVRGFLEAMTATPPIKTAVAREFLTHEASTTWQPTETVIYGAVTVARGTDSVVTADLTDAHRTDARGGWLGPVPDAESTLSFPTTLEDGQWRISALPNALIVPQTWFEQRFRQVSLYFYDASGTILVPDPVFVPRGRQFASALVNGLLTGPAPDLAGHELTFVPEGLRSLGSVPVDDGVARIDLTSDTAEVAMPSPPEAELLVSQLAWTLRQDPAIDRFKVTIGRRLLQLPGQETEFSVDHGHDYAPYVAGSSTQLFGLREGQLIGGSAQNLEPVTGPFGQPGVYDLRSVTPDIKVERAAAVSGSGSSLLIGPVKDLGDPVVTVIDSGEDLLKPAWDFSGRLWTVDRRSTGSVVGYVQDDKALTVDVPGISGQDVKDFLVSRDGTRLVAVLRGPDGADSIVASRILTTGEGRVVGALPAVDVSDPAGLAGTVRDIAWHSPTSIVVLRRLGSERFQVRSATVDGAPTGADSVSVTLEGKVLSLAGTPVPNEPSYAVTRGSLVDLAGPRAGVTPIDPVDSLGYGG